MSLHGSENSAPFHPPVDESCPPVENFSTGGKNAPSLDDSRDKSGPDARRARGEAVSTLRTPRNKADGPESSRPWSMRALRRTSAFSGRRTLCDVRSNALFDSLPHHNLLSLHFTERSVYRFGPSLRFINI